MTKRRTDQMERKPSAAILPFDRETRKAFRKQRRSRIRKGLSYEVSRGEGGRVMAEKIKRENSLCKSFHGLNRPPGGAKGRPPGGAAMVMLSRAFVLVLLLLLLPISAQSETGWTVEYFLSTDISQYHTFYAPGSYDLLLRPGYVVVYVIEPRGSGGSGFLGMYGASALGYPQAVLPADFPAISFPEGTDQAMIVPVSITTTPPTVYVPERAILPRLPKLLPRLFGWGVEAQIVWTLQRATTWLAAAMLWAPHDATQIYLSTVTVEVARLCAGLQTMILMLLVAGLIAVVMPARRRPWALGLVVAAVLLALEANALRVAITALGFEHLGAMARDAKDWIQIGTTGLALAQLVAAGRLIARGRAVPQPVSV
jgi:exosortase/archaeosortase family protein